MNDDPRVPEITRRLEELAAERPRTLAELTEAMEAFGPLRQLADEEDIDPVLLLEDLLMEHPGFWVLEDRRVASTRLAQTGLVLTHRLTEDEVSAGRLHVSPDLESLEVPREGLELEGGGRLFVHVDEGHLFMEGPPGWLDGFNPGQTIALRRGEASLQVEAVTEVGEGVAEADALAAAFEAQHRQEGTGIDLYPVVAEVIHSDLTLFRRPVRPVGELLEAVGLEARGGHVGRADEDWEPFWTVRNREVLERISHRWSLDPCCDEALEAVREAWSQFLRGRETPGREIGEALSHSAVAHAFIEYELTLGPFASEMLVAFADAVIEAGGHRGAVGAFLLRALVRDHAGDPLEAEADLRRAATVDGSHPLTNIELARFAGDRGDLAGALTAFRRAGLPADAPMRQRLEGLLPDHRGVGRNDPCPCGSGRKFKVCCQRNPRPDPTKRLAWLRARILAWAETVDAHDPRVGYAASAVSHADFDVEDMVAVTRDPLLEDLWIFGEELAEGYRSDRALLLPDEDLDLLEAWAEVRLRLWRIEAITPEGARLVDEASGETVEVVDDAHLNDVDPGDLILAWVGPGYDATRFLGKVLPVGPEQRSRLLLLLDRYDADPDLVASWYGERLLPASLTNREGHVLVQRTAWLEPWAPTETPEALLDERFERSDDGWVATTEIDGDVVIRSFLSWDGDMLQVVANSEERFADTLALLPDFRVVDETWRDPRDGDGGIPEPVELDDDARRELEEMIEGHEDRWLDEEIPALGGITPREAAADPERRPQLEQLLDDFDGFSLPPGAVGFNPERLRRKLGL